MLCCRVGCQTRKEQEGIDDPVAPCPPELVQKQTPPRVHPRWKSGKCTASKVYIALCTPPVGHSHSEDLIVAAVCNLSKATMTNG